MSEEEIRKYLKPFDAIRDKLPVEKDLISAPPAVRSSEWVDALRESKERIYRARSNYYTKHAKNPPGYHEAMTALNEAMLLTESAST